MGPQLWCRNLDPDKAPKRIWIIPSAVQSRVCQAVNVVSAGVVAFVRRDGPNSQGSATPGYEMTGNGVSLVYRYAGPSCKRRLAVSREDVSALTSSNGKPLSPSMLSESAGKALAKLAPGGCFIVPKSGGAGNNSRSQKGANAKPLAGVVVVYFFIRDCGSSCIVVKPVEMRESYTPTVSIHPPPHISHHFMYSCFVSARQLPNIGNHYEQRLLGNGSEVVESRDSHLQGIDIEALSSLNQGESPGLRVETASMSMPCECKQQVPR
eukprot:scaffold98364_cov27-Prasinocladus_malaysianus.AAC.1